MVKKDQLFVPNVNEAIITQEQFDSVQGVKKVSKRSSKKQKAKTENLFRGFLYCAECGRLLYAEKSKLANGKEMRYYHCPTYRDHHEKYRRRACRTKPYTDGSILLFQNQV